MPKCEEFKRKVVGSIWSSVDITWETGANISTQILIFNIFCCMKITITMTTISRLPLCVTLFWDLCILYASLALNEHCSPVNKRLSVYLCCALLWWCCAVYVHCQFNTLRPHTRCVNGCKQNLRSFGFSLAFSCFYLRVLCDQFHKIHTNAVVQLSRCPVNCSITVFLACFFFHFYRTFNSMHWHGCLLLLLSC